MSDILDTLVIGGGQSALACAYYLKRAKLRYLLLDEQPQPGASWHRAWESLTLFSPAEFSSLPGWMMPQSTSQYPTRQEVISYLAQYEQRYHVPVERPVHVQEVCFENGLFSARSPNKIYRARTLISATGTVRKPYIPSWPGIDIYEGLQLHATHYQQPDRFAGKRVLIVGGGNSGAQILAEVSRVAHTKWVTLEEASFLPDEVDGRVLFDQASARYYATQQGQEPDPATYNLGSIVMVPSLKEARARGVLQTVRPFERFYEKGVVWQDGTKEEVDALIWCTGYGYALDHLNCLNVKNEQGIVATKGTKSIKQAGLWLVGYGNWTGFASATLIGVGRTAGQTVTQIQEYLAQHKS